MFPAFLTAALSHSRVPLGAEDAAAFLQISGGIAPAQGLRLFPEDRRTGGEPRFPIPPEHSPRGETLLRI
jgi:hypothetical protein